jgi:hypothetical protein
MAIAPAAARRIVWLLVTSGLSARLSRDLSRHFSLTAWSIAPQREHQGVASDAAEPAPSSAAAAGEEAPAAVAPGEPAEPAEPDSSVEEMDRELERYNALDRCVRAYVSV